MEAVILIGLQASGKSSFYRERYLKTHDHVSKDLFPNSKKKQIRQDRLIDQAITAGRPFVVDNTNPARADRAVIIQKAKAAGYRVVGYYLSSKVEECLKRNAERSARKIVPEAALLGTAKRLERPKIEEGFDGLFYVSLAGDGNFKIEVWTEEAVVEA